MKLSSVSRKLILSIASLSMTTVCLAGTTYAWFAKNAEAVVNDTDFEIENYDGLSISVDGENFYSNIKNEQLYKAIVAKMDNLSVQDPSLTDTYVNAEYAKIQMADVTTCDLVNFQSIDKLNASDGVHYDLKTAEKNSYVTFDLYFRITQARNLETDKEYKLCFVSEDYSANTDSGIGVSYMKAGDSEITLNTAFECGGKSYFSGDKVAVNPVNAMRIGIIKDASVTEASKNVIYEPYAGLGSYAIEGEEGIYSPANNIMYQYLNAYAKYDMQALKDNKEIYEGTEKNFDGEVELGRFTTNGTSEYNDVKITVAIWLEGYDADYFAGCDITDLTCFLSFCKKEVE